MECTTRMFKADQESAGSRLDAYLTAQGAGYSRSFWQKRIDDGDVTVNGRPCKASYRMEPDDCVEIRLPPPKPAGLQAQSIPLDILYEDGELIVVNKPRGLVVHPAAGNPDGTMVNALLAHCGHLSAIGGVIRPGIVHRIDKETSGILVVAKNDRTHLHLALQFKEHSITRRYTAVIAGVLKTDGGEINAPIGRHPLLRKQMAVVPRGREAKTHFQVLERLHRATVIEARLETGRTHQIRVHMSHIGHPLIGDRVYGGRRQPDDFPGQALHARLLGFTHPGHGGYVEFLADPPPDMLRLMAKLRAER